MRNASLFFHKHQQISHGQHEKKNSEQSTIVLIKSQKPGFRVVWWIEAVALQAIAEAGRIKAAKTPLEAYVAG